MPSETQLGATVLEALRVCKQMRADGVPDPEIAAYLTQALRAAWPFIREWKYKCEICNDTGWEIRECREGARCGRPQRIGPKTIGGYVNDTGMGQRCALDPGYTHTYAIACTCRKGFAFKQQLDRDFEESAKPRGKGHVRP